jgi:hypothetical protein
VFRANPQISTPVKGIPNNWKLKISFKEEARKSQVAPLSPVQCWAYAPEPKIEDLVIMKGS